MPDNSKFGCLTFQCNICGAACEYPMLDLGRETPSCRNCGSTVRMRSIVHLLSMELFGQSLVLPDFPTRLDIRGMGLSDWNRYADPLAQRLSYTNTFYHQEPRLDITRIDPALEGSLDFLISTDVFEHIVPPISVAFANVRRLLKPDGVFIFSVPYTLDADTWSIFPNCVNTRSSNRTASEY